MSQTFKVYAVDDDPLVLDIIQTIGIGGQGKHGGNAAFFAAHRFDQEEQRAGRKR